jgi:hypothetical protein
MKGNRVFAPKVSVMSFYHRDGIVPSWKFASRFAGEGGRIATLPDIINARLATKPGSFPWETYFTTTTAEYMGISRGGNKILIVAHGVGPMSTLDGILKAYSWEFKDKERNQRGGRITHNEFIKLESGTYGDIQIVDLSSYMHRYQYPFLGYLRGNAAVVDPLLKARLGPRATDYIIYHTHQAREWHAEQTGVDPDNKYNLPNHEAFCDRLRAMNMRMPQPSSFPFIIKNGDASNCPYGYRQLEEGFAFAHLISIGRLMNLHHVEDEPDGRRESYESLVCDVSCHEWSDGTRLVGIRQGIEVINIAKGPEDIEELIRKNWQKLMKPAPETKYVGFRNLIKINQNTWFTETLKKGNSMDSGEPEFLVTSIEKIEGPLDFVTKIDGYPIFFRYDMKDVVRIAPKKANAYSIIGDPDFLASDRNYHRASIQFYRVKIDTSRRLMRPTEISQNYDKLIVLLNK